MTIEELYEWAKSRGFEDCHIVVNCPGADGLDDHLLTEDNIGVPYNQGTKYNKGNSYGVDKIIWLE